MLSSSHPNSSNISEGKDMSCMKHDIALKRPCVECMEAMSEIKKLQSS